MKALSVKQPWAGYIASGQKTIETRSWNTNYRGELLICSSLKPDKYVSQIYYNNDLCSVFGKALCLVDVVDCLLWEEKHKKDSLCMAHGGYAWMLENIRKVELINVKGQLSIFNLPPHIVEHIKIV